MTTKDLLIHYDESGQEIVFSEFDAISGNKRFAFKVPLALYQDKGAEGAERIMGETVFTFFDRWADVKMGLRNYVEEAKAVLASGVADTERLAKEGNAEAQYQLAIECFTDGVKGRSTAKLEEAESWLRKAAEGGYKTATDYLENFWEREKASALRGMSDS